MTRLSHLDALESKTIQILRGGVAEAKRPVLLFSGGKDSTVLAHLTVIAFYPSKPPLPLLHVDSTWEFREVLVFRNRFAATHQFELLLHHNEDDRAKGLNPIDDGEVYTTLMRTKALKQALDQGRHDVIFGGARRDEEITRAKERIVSIRGEEHVWDPRAQRPELWSNYNWRLLTGESARVYPLSDWTEQDLWTYIFLRRIELCPLYLDAARPVVERAGKLIVIDDTGRAKALGLGAPRMENVRFRSLGCSPVTAATRSDATNIGAVVSKTLTSSQSERSGRISDSRSLEAQKRDGYF